MMPDDIYLLESRGARNPLAKVRDVLSCGGEEIRHCSTKVVAETWTVEGGADSEIGSRTDGVPGE